MRFLYLRNLGDSEAEVETSSFAFLLPPPRSHIKAIPVYVILPIMEMILCRCKIQSRVVFTTCFAPFLTVGRPFTCRFVRPYPGSTGRCPPDLKSVVRQCLPFFAFSRGANEVPYRAVHESVLLQMCGHTQVVDGQSCGISFVLAAI